VYVDRRLTRNRLVVYVGKYSTYRGCAWYQNGESTAGSGSTIGIRVARVLPGLGQQRKGVMTKLSHLIMPPPPACVASVHYEERGSVCWAWRAARNEQRRYMRITNWTVKVPRGSPFLGPVHEMTSRSILGVAAH
jgi:hypothetical protein